MASPSQRTANRANARSSTGPRTRAGKARSSANARKHGLNIALALDPEMSAEVEALAKHILEDSDSALLPFARSVAEAQLEVMRVRWARHLLMAEAHDDPDYDSLWALRVKSELALCLARSPAPRGSFLTQALMRMLPYWLSRRRSPAQRFVIGLHEFADKLAVLERYERRALSKRMAAITAFDAAHRAPPPAP